MAVECKKSLEEEIINKRTGIKRRWKKIAGPNMCLARDYKIIWMKTKMKGKCARDYWWNPNVSMNDLEDGSGNPLLVEIPRH